MLKSVSAALNSVDNSRPTVAIKGFKGIGNCMARVVLNVVHTPASRENHELINDELRSLSGGKLEAIRGSFRSTSKSHYEEELVGMVGVVHKAMAVGEALPKGFVATASNMFLDEEQDMWHLKSTAAGKMLVKEVGVEDDMALVGMLNSLSSGNAFNTNVAKRIASLCSGGEVTGGDVVTYATSGNRIALGIVLATNEDNSKAIVLASDEEEPEEVDTDAILSDEGDAPEADLSEEESLSYSLSAAKGVNTKILVDYYRKVYGQHPKFFNELKARIESHQWM